MWKSALKYGLGFGLLAVVLAINWHGKNGSLGLSDVLSQPLNMIPLVGAAICLTIATLLTFVRWHILVRSIDLPFTLRNAIRLGLIGYYFNTFLPGSIGGDVLKAVAISREQKRRTHSVATVLIDRAVGLWALILVVCLAGTCFYTLDNPMLLTNAYLMHLYRLTLWIIGASIVGWIALGFLPERRADRFARRLLWLPKIGGVAAEFWRAVWLYRKHSTGVIAAVLLSLVSHTFFVLTFHFAVRTFDAPHSNGPGALEQHFLIVPVGLTIQALFPAPGGVGGGEAAFGWLYHVLGRDQATGILGCLAFRLITFGMGMLGYLVYLRMRTTLPATTNIPVTETEDPVIEAESPNMVNVPLAERA